MENFDELALNWDNDPKRMERAKTVAHEILNLLPDLGRMEGFEYGCGTGLLSFCLQPFLKKIWLGDSSSGMLSVLEQKIRKYGIPNMEPLKIDLTVDQLFDVKFDLIYTLMTLHHITNTDGIIDSFYELLRPSGYLCIADLDKEDGSFHGTDFLGHNGFDIFELSEKLELRGFRNLNNKICYEIIKQNVDGVEKKYPVFVLIAQKV